VKGKVINFPGEGENGINGGGIVGGCMSCCGVPKGWGWVGNVGPKPVEDSITKDALGGGRKEHWVGGGC